MLAQDKSTHAKPNQYLPSKSLGKCELCPASEFTSITEAKIHVSLLHPNYNRKSLPNKEQVFQCKIEKCGLTYYQLAKHREMENHFKRNSSKTSKKKSKEVDDVRKKQKITSEKFKSFFSEDRDESHSSDDE